MPRLALVPATTLAIAFSALVPASAIAATREEAPAGAPATEICQNGGCGSCTTGFGMKGELVNGTCYAC